MVISQTLGYKSISARTRLHIEATARQFSSGDLLHSSIFNRSDVILIKQRALRKRSVSLGLCYSSCSHVMASSSVTVLKTDVAEPQESKETFTYLLYKNIHCIQSTCKERLKFEVEYSLQHGTSENSYLYLDSARESTVLIDLPVEAFLDSFIKSLKSLVNIKSIGNIIISHLDPKCIPVLKTILEENFDEKIKIYLSLTAMKFLKSVFDEEKNKDFLYSKCELCVVRSSDSLKLSNGRVFNFIKIATPRWPDMISVYDEKRKFLFSSKFFSAHVAPNLFENKNSLYGSGTWSMYGNDWKYFFETMLAPSSSQAATALKKLNLVVRSKSKLQLANNKLWNSMMSILKIFTATGDENNEKNDAPRVVFKICPMHGPVIKNSLYELIDNYWSWVRLQSNALGKVAVFYASAYGNTAALAQAISHGIGKSGLAVETINLEVSDRKDIENAITTSNGFIIGSPTLGGHMPTQVQSALGTIMLDTKAKEMPCGVFGSFGWSGEAVDELNDRLSNGGFKFAFDPIKVKFKPTNKDLQICEESGTDLAQEVLKNIKKRERQELGVTQSFLAPGKSQSVGRLVGSLCVISGRDGDSQSGMLASWVTQASFDPPGITVSVKKDRAIENMLLPGNSFVVNILGENNNKDIMKHMLKGFKPGEERFEGLNTKVCETTNCIILTDAVSYLECSVKARMEAGDHWVVYGIVNRGKVQDAKGKSAVHHRRVGTNY